MHVGPDVLDPMLEAVVRTDMHQIASGMVPTWDEVLKRGVKWKPEPPGDEHFDPASTVVIRGHGDCDDIAPYSVATDRLTGKDPYATARVVELAPGRFHAVHVTGSGDIKDPSADAGMYEYHAPVQPMLSGVRKLFRPQIAWRPVSVGGYVSRCDMPTGHFAVSGHGYGPTMEHAMTEAINGACCVGMHLGAHPDHMMQLQAADALLRGADPAELAEVLHAMGHHNARTVVGSIFGSIAHLAKSALPIAAHFVPVPGAGIAADMLAHAIPGGGGGHSGAIHPGSVAPGGGVPAGDAAGAPHPHEVLKPAVVVPPFVVRW